MSTPPTNINLRSHCGTCDMPLCAVGAEDLCGACCACLDRCIGESSLATNVRRGNFYEEDEPIENIEAAFEAGEKVITAPPGETHQPVKEPEICEGPIGLVSNGELKWCARPMNHQGPCRPHQASEGEQ